MFYFYIKGFITKNKISARFYVLAFPQFDDGGIVDVFVVL